MFEKAAQFAELGSGLPRDELFLRRPADDYSYTDWLYRTLHQAPEYSVGTAGPGGYPGPVFAAGSLLLAGPR